MIEQFKSKLPPDLHNRLDQYAGLFKRIEVPAKTILLKEGEISRRSFYIEKGCLRVWFNNNGKDVTFQFFFEKQGLSSIESFRKNIPSICTIETIEPSIIHVLSKNDFNTIIDDLGQDPVFLNVMIDTLLERQLHYMREFQSFIRDTPPQRYLNLIKEKPHILQRVPQHYIASYLGITTVSLSRIRNKLLKSTKQGYK